MLSARIDRLKEDWFLFLGKLAALSTPQLGIIYGFRDRTEVPVREVRHGAQRVAQSSRLIA